MPAPDDASPVVLAFLEQLVDDVARGEVAEFASYRARFPGHDAVLAAHYEDVVDAAAGRADGDAGTRRVGRYRLLEELGTGAQGVVHLAEDERLGRRVALKVLGGAALGRRLQLFEREATLVSQLDHPNVCALFDAGVDGDVAWLAMRYVPGESLASRLARVVDSGVGPPTRPADVRATLRLVETVARALHACHEAGVIHRDVKPSNIMVTDAGDPVVLDFGVARLTAPDAATLTGTGDVLGTPAYMSPEQLDAEPTALDRRADVYSLGVTLYECLTLERPFAGRSLDAVYRAIRVETPPNPRAVNSTIGRDLVAIIEKALEKRPERRYATAAAFADDLAAAAEGRPIAARRVGPIGRAVRWAQREPIAASLVAVVLVAFPTITALVTQRVLEAPQRRAQEQDAVARARDVRLAEGWLELAMRRIDEALAIFREVVAATQADASPDAERAGAEARIAIVMTELAARRPDRAAAELDGIRASLPRCVELLLDANVLRSRGDRAAAERLEADAPEPRSREELWLVGASELNRVDQLTREDADAALSRAYERTLRASLMWSERPRLTLYAQLAMITGKGRDLHARRVVAETIRANWPDNGVAAFWAGYAAIGASLRFTNRIPDRDEAEQLRELVDLAIDAYRVATELDPERATAHNNLGQALQARGRLDEALGCFRRAIELDDRLVEAYGNLGLILEARGDVDGAIAACRRGVELRPIAIEPNVNLGAVLVGAGRFADAIDVLGRAVERRPNNAMLHYQLGIAHDTSGDAEAAAVSYRDAIACDDAFFSAYNNLGTLLQQQGDVDGAIAAYRRVVELEPDHVLAWLNLGLALQGQQDYEAALDALRRGHELGSAIPGWSHPSAEWVAACEALARAARER